MGFIETFITSKKEHVREQTFTVRPYSHDDLMSISLIVLFRMNLL